MYSNETEVRIRSNIPPVLDILVLGTRTCIHNTQKPVKWNDERGDDLLVLVAVVRIYFVLF